jgi:D-serine deaminase-like pyridoxal phosphate-dependent protein
MDIHEYEVGLHKGELDTPALLVNLDAIERNIQRMADFSRAHRVNLRPHAKIHKATPILAWMQLRAGAIGITASKLSEAEVLASAGIRDLLIANQVVGARKIRRLVNLAASTDLIVAVDSIDNVQEISRAAHEKRTTVGVLVEVNIGNERCGVEPFATTRDFVQSILPLQGIRFRGVMGYDGHLAFVEDLAERHTRSQAAYRILNETRDLLCQAGIAVEIVSGGGTGTYQSAAQTSGLTELQIGTYLFNDTTYRDAGLREFDCALTILSTVISRPKRAGAEDLAILDVGRKAMSTTYGLPEMKSPPGAIFSMPQEHSRLRLSKPEDALGLKVGDQVELWVKDANGTINLFDQMYALRGDRVEAVWNLGGRGKVT